MALQCHFANVDLRKSAAFKPLGRRIKTVLAIARCRLEERDMAQQSLATIQLLEAFTNAFNRHDVDTLLSLMTEDCVFEAAAGPQVYGTRFSGPEAVGAAFSQVWATFPDAHWGNGRHFVDGDFGVSEWTFTGTRADGARMEADGCDLFTFRDGKIAVKKAFRKERPLLEAQ